MKKNKLFAVLILFISIWFQTAKGQNCSIPSCGTDSIHVRTGYDEGANSFIDFFNWDNEWTLVSAPSYPNIGILPQPGVVTPGNTSWGTYSTSRWLSINRYGFIDDNNPAPDSLPYTFKYCFCTCEDGDVTIDLSILFDDELAVYLDGVLLDSVTSGYHHTNGNDMNINQTMFLNSGEHCFTFNLRNTGSVAMGLNVTGSVVGDFLSKYKCCNPKGKICGTKYKDEDGNGERLVYPTTEPGIENWQIVLKEADGTPIDTVLTDSFGNYCFLDLDPAKIYFVEEINGPWWTQTEPDSNMGYTVILDSGELFTATFGNHYCDVEMEETLNLSTGFNEETSSLYSIPAEDDYWTIVSAPNSTLPYRPQTHSGYGSWSPAQSGSRWLVPAIGNVPAGVYDYERCFCLSEDFQNAQLTLNIRADDQATVYINGNLLGSTPTGAFNPATPYSFSTSNQSDFKVGQNCVHILVNNAILVSGLNVSGSVSTSNVDGLVNNCCDHSAEIYKPRGSICGAKFHDEDCDGEQDSGEIQLAGWTIVLYDSSDNPIDSVVTDQNGNYCFEELYSGTYYLRERNQAGWNQSFPGSSLLYTHEIVLGIDQNLNASFGNCEEQCFIETNLMIVTGVDPESLMQYPIGSTDPNWKVKDLFGGINPPYVQPYTGSGWITDIGQAQWLTPSTAPNSRPGVYKYVYCFCIDDPSLVTGNVTFRAHEGADIKVNNSIAYSVGTGTATNPTPEAFSIPGSMLVSGENCIEVAVSSSAGGAVGLLMEVMINSSGPYNLAYDCCNPDGGPMLIPVADPLKTNSDFDKPNQPQLFQNQPNPFSESCDIHYFLPVDMNGRIVVRDLGGKRIATIELKETGDAYVRFNARNLPAAVYYYSLEVDNITIETRKLVVSH